MTDEHHSIQERLSKFFKDNEITYIDTITRKVKLSDEEYIELKQEIEDDLKFLNHGLETNFKLFNKMSKDDILDGYALLNSGDTLNIMMEEAIEKMAALERMAFVINLFNFRNKDK